MAVNRTSTGRKKIAMQKIENEDALQVCFSKRRNGLFKKAGELSIMCGVHIAVIVFSPSGKVYSYGHPSVEAVFDRFIHFHPALRQRLGEYHLDADGRSPHQPQMVLQELNRRHAALTARVEAETAKQAALQAELTETAKKMRLPWATKKVQNMNAEEAQAYKAAISQLMDKVKARQESLHLTNLSLSPSPSPPTTFGDDDGFGDFSDSGLSFLNYASPNSPPAGDDGAASGDSSLPWII